MATLNLDKLFYLFMGKNTSHDPPVSGSNNIYPHSINDLNEDGMLSVGIDLIDGVPITRIIEFNTILFVRASGQETGFTSSHNLNGYLFYLSDGRGLFSPNQESIEGVDVLTGILPIASAGDDLGGVSLFSVSISDLGDLPPPTPPCFVAGTRILTPRGEVPVERLRAGDMVMTHDCGPQPILWAGGRIVGGYGNCAPVRFETGAIGNSRPLLVSQRHRILIGGWQAALFCGEDEVLVAAKKLVNAHDVTIAPCRKVHYVHLLLDAHHVLTADGAASESFFPGDTILDADPAIHESILAAWDRAHSGSDIRQMRTARPVARGAEASVIGTRTDLPLGGFPLHDFHGAMAKRPYRPGPSTLQDMSARA